MSGVHLLRSGDYADLHKKICAELAGTMQTRSGEKTCVRRPGHARSAGARLVPGISPRPRGIHGPHRRALPAPDASRSPVCVSYIRDPSADTRLRGGAHRPGSCLMRDLSGGSQWEEKRSSTPCALYVSRSPASDDHESRPVYGLVTGLVPRFLEARDQVVYGLGAGPDH